jgi:LysM repeat protein
MSTIEISLLPTGRYHVAVPHRGVVTHRTYVRRRLAVGASAAMLALLLALGAGSFVTGRGSEPASAAAARPSIAPAVATYVVAPGDTLWSIAGTYRGEVPRGEYVERLIAANGGRAGLLVGQRLVLP